MILVHFKGKPIMARFNIYFLPEFYWKHYLTSQIVQTFIMIDKASLKVIVDAADKIATWSISLLGGSVLAIISTSYAKPAKKMLRVFYLLFVPAWVFCALAIKEGDSIRRMDIMAELNAHLIPRIVVSMNDSFTNLMNYFNFSILFFCLWMICYLIWFMLSDAEKKA